MQFSLASKRNEEICHQSLKLSYKVNVFLLLYYFFRTTQKLQSISL